MALSGTARRRGRLSVGGPETAHRIVNTSKTVELRFISVSTELSPEIRDDSGWGKTGVSVKYPLTPDGKPQGVRLLTRTGTTPGCWEGE